MKLLLHSCCGPCSVQCIKALIEDSIKPDIFWYNPNIHPYTEYCSRRDSLTKFAKDKGISVIMENEYGLRSFVKAVESEPAGGRCAYCYRTRLERTAAVAAENHYDAFSASLLISPYQNHDLLRKTGEEAAAQHGVSFFYQDFRPRFREGQKEAREAGYYMQKYCGCIYSEEERYLSSKKKA